MAGDTSVPRNDVFFFQPMDICNLDLPIFPTFLKMREGEKDQKMNLEVEKQIPVTEEMNVKRYVFQQLSMIPQWFTCAHAHPEQEVDFEASIRGMKFAFTQ
jgi:hypothetical protein